MNPKVWEASGHVATFNDPMVECKNCHERYRADNLLGSTPGTYYENKEEGVSGTALIFDELGQRELKSNKSVANLNPEYSV